MFVTRLRPKLLLSLVATWLAVHLKGCDIDCGAFNSVATYFY